MDKLALAIGVTASLVQLAGYWQYNKVMLLGGHKSNASSWFMWATGGATELVSYASLVKTWAKTFLPAVCAVVAIVTFVRMWRRERCLEIEKRDLWIIALDVLVSGLAIVSPYASNALLGIDISLSFWPILFTTWMHPEMEHPKPWRTWTIAYALLTVVVILQWESAWELIYPVSCVVLHAAIWRLSSGQTVRSAAIC